MSDIYSSVCISSVCQSICSMADVETSNEIEEINPLVEALIKSKNKKIDRVVIYNPDAVGLWLYQKYTNLFTEAAVRSDIAMPMLSVMPSVTPVCFATMYSGVMPDVHGIKKYEKPVLTVDTAFDYYIKSGKKCAIVSTEGDSISKIFLERDMDYYIYESIDEVNKKALELIDEDKYDLIVIYNGNYDSTMHKNGPENEKSIDALKSNIEFYSVLVDRIGEKWKNHTTFYGFCPDHGCHEIDGECGSHGLDMQEDMNVIHFYGIK